MKTFYGLFLTCVFFLGGCSKDIDENPPVVEKLLTGVYSNEYSKIELKESNDFNLELKGNKYSGGWRLQYSMLYLNSVDGGLFYFKVISEDGSYQLIHIKHFQQDPDEWDWSSVMKKEQLK